MKIILLLLVALSATINARDCVVIEGPSASLPWASSIMLVDGIEFFGSTVDNDSFDTDLSRKVCGGEVLDCEVRFGGTHATNETIRAGVYLDGSLYHGWIQQSEGNGSNAVYRTLFNIVDDLVSAGICKFPFSMPN